MNLSLVSNSSAQTIKIAAGLASRLRGGEVIELISDVGGGKTTFVKGLARGLGYGGLVSSPSFTLNQQYKGIHLTLQHFDFYRLDDAGVMASQLAESISAPNSVVVIEWAGIAEAVLPAKRLAIAFRVLSINRRQLQLKTPAALDYLIKNISIT